MFYPFANEIKLHTYFRLFASIYSNFAMFVPLISSHEYILFSFMQTILKMILGGTCHDQRES